MFSKCILHEFHATYLSRYIELLRTHHRTFTLYLTFRRGTNMSYYTLLHTIVHVTAQRDKHI